MDGSKNIVLVGFMGTGKTSIGKILARELGREVIDVDRYIEEKEKRSISDLFEKEGEARFRELEKEAVAEVSKKERIVITTGGGAVLDPENMRVLKESGWVVGLSASPESIFERVRNSKHRPLLRGEDIFLEIKKLLEIRRPFYEKADITFETSGMSASQVAKVILEALKGKL